MKCEYPVSKFAFKSSTCTAYRVVPQISPGPGAHDGAAQGGFTKQRLSYNKSMPQYGFG
jgi:hypothetical protein